MHAPQIRPIGYGTAAHWIFLVVAVVLAAATMAWVWHARRGQAGTDKQVGFTGLVIFLAGCLLIVAYARLFV
jgi:hypothetical protein